eukprot:GILJ01020978.1.p1 GENE.GILJ01020978.1~~GILJ01020978.1.p1  ORF type:complete len:900 (+),score=107.86 GILJ01020978.1:103-2802(+)
MSSSSKRKRQDSGVLAKSVNNETKTKTKKQRQTAVLDDKAVQDELLNVVMQTRPPAEWMNVDTQYVAAYGNRAMFVEEDHALILIDDDNDCVHSVPWWAGYPTPNNIDQSPWCQVWKIQFDRHPQIHVTFMLDIAFLKHLLKNGVDIPFVHLVVKAMIDNHNPISIQDFVGDSSAVTVPPFKDAGTAPVAVMEGRRLFAFQSQTVQWMYQLERCLHFEYKQFMPLYNSGVYLDTTTLSLSLSSPRSVLTTRGGILADEMGLGKTTSVAGLIASHRLSQGWVHDASPSITRIRTRATLVLCPSHLVDYWKSELEACDDSFQVLTVTTTADLQSLSYGDLMESPLPPHSTKTINEADNAADSSDPTRVVVVVSYQFVLSARYQAHEPSIGASTTAHLAPEILDTRAKRLAFTAGRIKMMPRKVVERVSAPQLEHFEWARVVCDEFHQVVHRDMRTLSSTFLSSFRWVVSATPFPEGDKTFNCVMEFLDCKRGTSGQAVRVSGPLSLENVTRHDEIVRRYDENVTMGFVRTWLFCRHTAASVGNEIRLPELRREVVRLWMSPTERILYESVDMARNNAREIQRAVCVYPPMIKDYGEVLGTIYKPLEVIQETFSDDTIKQIEYLKTLKSNNTCPHQKAAIEQHLATAERTLSFLRDQLPEISKSPQTCPICYDDMTGSVAVTRCGHVFCYECICRAVTSTNSHSCPNCRLELVIQHDVLVTAPLATTPLTDATVDTSTKEERGEHNQEKAVDKDKMLIDRYGTKLATVIQYIKERPTGRFLVYGEWDSMLMSKVSETLNQEGIFNLACKGNVQQRMMAVHAFQNKMNEIQVMMLTSDHCANGTNLTAATHVLFLTPCMPRPTVSVEQVEQRAIKRAHRIGLKHPLTVVHFVMDESFESSFIR